MFSHVSGFRCAQIKGRALAISKLAGAFTCLLLFPPVLERKNHGPGK
jgi:hypothetical protein